MNAACDGGEPQAEVSSPCIQVCRMNPETGFCEGCCRTIDEISLWPSLSDENKRAVLALLPARKSAS